MPDRSRRRWMAALTAAVLLSAGVGQTILRFAAEPGEQDGSGKVTQPVPVTPHGATTSPALAKNPRAPSLAPPSTSTAESAADVYRALSLDPNPATQYRAYHMLSGCSAARRSLQLSVHLPRDAESSKVFEETQRNRAHLASHACAGLPFDNAAIRAGHARIAAEHGIVGAAADFYFEGPNGNPSGLLTRPDDLLVRAWFDRATSMLVRDAEHGQAEAAAQLAQIFSMGPDAFRDKVLAGRYASLALALLERTGALPASTAQQRRRLVQHAMAGLSPEQVDAIALHVKRIIGSS